MQQYARIYLVGAGPGDPDLLTVKALRLRQLADTVIYARLISGEIQRLIPAQADRIYVGRTTCQHTLSQTEINTLLIIGDVVSLAGELNSDPPHARDTELRYA